MSEKLPLATTAILAGFVISQNLEHIKTVATKLTSMFFKRIDIPLKTNQLLFPKLQTLLKKRAIGGNYTVLENGNSQMLTGAMVLCWPAALVYVSTAPEIRAKIYLNRLCYSADKFLQNLEQLNITDNSVALYTLNHRDIGWRLAKTLECVELHLLYNDEHLETLKNNVEHFLLSKSNNLKIGKTHKLTVLLGGPAGCGKTTLIKWLAMHFHRDVYVVDPAYYFNDDVMNAMNDNSIPIFKNCEGGIILFEDIDRYFANLFSRQDRPNISKFLNFLDGLCTPDDIIIALTANYEGDIPDVIRRDGRIDLTINLPYVTPEIVDKACRLYKIDRSLIKLEGQITTSHLVKTIESQLVCRPGDTVNSGEGNLISPDNPLVLKSADRVMTSSHGSIDLLN